MPFVFLFLFATASSVETISGTVTDQSGQPIAGVNVVIKGTGTGTQTNFEGKYSIEAEEGDVLVFSFLGFKTKERKVKGQKKINVQLKPDNAPLEEVVISGFAGRIRGVSPISITESESYKDIQENIFKRVSTAPLSTFSIDVDKAAYSNIRRMINNGQEIPEDAVRIEEMINYFDYNYPEPEGEHPFSINTEIAQTPWNPETKLVKIGL